MRGACKMGVLVHECLLARTRLEQLVSRRPLEQVRWAQGPRRGVRWTKESMISHALVNLECVKGVLSPVCFRLYQPKRRKGTWLSVLVFSMSAGDARAPGQCPVCGSRCS